MGLKVKRATPEEDQYIKDNYLTTPALYMSRQLNRPQSFASSRMKILNLVVPEDTVNKFRAMGAFKKGMVSQFKGTKMSDRFTPEHIEKLKKYQFKNGFIPVNSRSNGDTILRRDKRGNEYTLVRISGSKWRPLHTVKWEEKYGKIDKGFVLCCKTDNTLNCDTDNWELITRKESITRHSANLYLKDRYVAHKIAFNNKDLKEEIIKNHPQIIEIKRQQIRLNREIRKYA